MEFETIASPGLWIGFTIFVLGMLALDLGVFHRKAHEVRFKEAMTWTLVWIALALVFNAGVHHFYGSQKGLEFLTGYVIEKALSIDNVFVFLVIFGSFAVPKEYQHRILFWGVLGAILMRAVFIYAGAALLNNFHWIIYVFGGVLIFTGIKLLAQRNEELHPERNPLYRAFVKLIPSVPEYHGQRFFVRLAGKWFATPLLLVLAAIEITDVVFAVDSIPAIFAITTDPFIVYTSNIFAILGLRALYFVLAGAMERFVYLKIGLSLVLVFVGVKMTIVDLYKVPIALSLAVIASILAITIIASFIKTSRRATAAVKS